MTSTVLVVRTCRFLGPHRFKKKSKILLEDQVKASDKDGKYDDNYHRPESSGSTLLSHIGPIDMDSRASHLRHPQMQSNLFHTDYAPSYISIDPSAYAGDKSTGVRATYTVEVPPGTHNYGTDYWSAYRSGNATGYKQNIGLYNQQPITAYSSEYGAPVTGPYEPL